MEDQLTNARHQINDVDRQITSLLEKRFKAVQAVNEYKQQHQLPVLDQHREEQVLAKVADHVTDSATVLYIQNIFKEIMHQSRAFQDAQRKEG
ncbi:chorismate mutase [Limosilactobacillus fermentum]|nr:chorismate mutase [Limosilactobacillus fermentum]